MFAPILVAISLGSANVGSKKASCGLFWPLRYRFSPFDCEYLENSKSRGYVSIGSYHQLDASVLKCNTRGGNPQGSPL